MPPKRKWLGRNLQLPFEIRDDNLGEAEGPSAYKSNRNTQHKRIVVKGIEFDSINSAAVAYGMSRNTVDYRLSKGWSPEQALGLEPRPGHAGRTRGVAVAVQGHEFANIKQAAKHFGRAYTHVFDRLKAGCTIEQALGLVKRTDSFSPNTPN